jgi:hypothetical protein
MIKWASLFVIVLGRLNAAEQKPAPEPMTFFVATNGNDSWSGSSPTKGGKADGPFATLPRALSAARASAQHATTIYIRSGVHFLTEPLTITPADSGITLAAYRIEKPVISGGRRITGWKEVALGRKNLWSAETPETRNGRWLFRELWINGRRAVRARHPNRGYLSVVDLPDKASDWTQGHTRFRYREGDLIHSSSLTQAEVVVMTRWVESRLPVTSLDEAQHIVSFGKRSVFELAPGDSYYVEGYLEALDTPGEWCLDSNTGKIYYQPRAGERLSEMDAIAPVLSQVLRIEGHPEQTRFVERASFKGLTFSHCEWYFPVPPRAEAASSSPKLEVGGFSQAAMGVSAAVWGEGLRNCVFEGCSFSNLGNYALELGRGCQSNRVVRCEFSTLGAGGIKVGEGAIRDKAEELARANEISDCHIHDGGLMFHSAIGVWIGQSPDNQLTHNLIQDFYYSGISIGWTWGYGSALASNNLVAFNHVHHIGVKSDGDGPILSDMAGIYTLGKQPGTRIINNIWHDIAAARYGGWGIYFDEGSSGILAQSNVVYCTTHGGFHQHYGETNQVWNNIFAFARDQQLQRSRVEPHQSFTFETNIVYFDKGSLLGSEWADDHFQMDWNVFFDARLGTTPDKLNFGKATIEEWRHRGHDRNSVLADPLFIDPGHHNFRLRPNSPAFKLGFQTIDVSQVGIRPARGSRKMP